MTPAQAIGMLDRQLAQHGETVVLRRPVANGVPIDAEIRGFVRGFKPGELVGGINQGDQSVVLSPTAVMAAGWPLPVKIGDKVLVAGALKNIQAPEHVRMLDQIVRINLQVRG